MPHRKATHSDTAITSVSVRGQTSIPKHLRQTCHIHEGDMIRWRRQGSGLLVERILLRPAREESLSAADWKLLDRLVAQQRQRQQVTRYTSFEEGKQHSRALMKYAR